jgi:predicted dehydrogenase
VRQSFSIGFLGAGPVTQAIHLPVLATLGDGWRVVKVMDTNPDVARKVAGRCGAQPVADEADVIGDPAIDVVAICSPNGFHARQAIAACAAGKRAILCEKPLAIDRDEALAVRAAAARSGTAIIVGTMHLHDPGFCAGLADWQTGGDEAIAIKSTIFLPPNADFTGLATEEVLPGGPPPTPAGLPSPEAQRAMLRQTILGLAIHHVPLVRLFHGQVGTVLSARRLPPAGFSILMEDGNRTAEMLAFMPGQWSPSWTFAVSGASADLSIDFPPSYVLAGSGRATLATGPLAKTHWFPVNGYQAQWQQLHHYLTSGEPLVSSLDSMVADLDFALDLADKATAVQEIVQ